MSEPVPERPSTAPALRASDADRERTAERLRFAAEEGRLTFEELDERLDAAYAARTYGELEHLVADVAVEPGAHAAPERPAGLPVRPGGGGTSWIVALMGGRERKGHWRVAERCTVVNLMGGSELDLNDAELASREVEMTVVSIMGGGEVRVPEGLGVEVSDVAIMGGNTIDLGTERPLPGRPLLRLRLISIMGGTEVKRGRKPTRAERKEQRRRDHELHRGWH